MTVVDPIISFSKSCFASTSLQYSAQKSNQFIKIMIAHLSSMIRIPYIYYINHRAMLCFIFFISNQIIRAIKQRVHYMWVYFQCIKSHKFFIFYFQLGTKNWIFLLLFLIRCINGPCLNKIIPVIKCIFFGLYQGCSDQFSRISTNSFRRGCQLLAVEILHLPKFDIKYFQLN